MSIELHLLSAINPLWDENLIDLFNGIKVALPDGTLATIAKQIAAIFALCYLAFKAYTMIVGEGRFEIMPLFRPFVIALCIINFGLITTLVGLPGQAATDTMGDKFHINSVSVDQALDEKKALSDSLFKELIAHTNEIAPKFGGVTGTGIGELPDIAKALPGAETVEVMGNLQSYITVYEQLLWMKLSMWLQQFIEWVVVAIFKGICYCIFFLQLIILAVLTWIGPISFAFSIASPFRNSWVHWAGKYIAVSFYSAIGYFILNLSFAVLKYGIDQEIDRYQEILSKKDYFAMFGSMMLHIDNFIAFVFIALVVAVAGIIATPIISTWIVETAGTGNAIFGTGVKAVTGTAKAGTGAVTKAASAGASAAL